jgi:hypothetical protein
MFKGKGFRLFPYVGKYLNIYQIKYVYDDDDDPRLGSFSPNVLHIAENHEGILSLKSIALSIYFARLLIGCLLSCKLLDRISIYCPKIVNNVSS